MKEVKLERVMSEPEYRAMSNLSYSKLSSFDRSARALITNNFKETEPLIYGSAVDVLLFDGEEVFDQQFAVLTAEKPSWMLEKVYKGILDELKAGQDDFDPKPISSNLEDHADIILRVANSEDYGKGWKPETIVRKTVEAAGEIFKFTIENEGKKILSPEQYEFAHNSVTTLKAHEFTKHLFEEVEGVDVYFQFPIEWEIQISPNKTIPCKSLLDILIVDHNNKSIQPKDLKTTGKSVLAFPGSFVEWKYYLQAAFYTEAVRYLVRTKYPELKDYKIELFEFVVISSKDPMRPLMFRTTPNDIKAGTYGGTLDAYDREVRGYLSLMRDMLWHEENAKYDYPKDVYDKNGLITLDVFKNEN